MMQSHHREELAKKIMTKCNDHCFSSTTAIIAIQEYFEDKLVIIVCPDDIENVLDCEDNGPPCEEECKEICRALKERELEDNLFTRRVMDSVEDCIAVYFEVKEEEEKKMREQAKLALNNAIEEALENLDVKDVAKEISETLCIGDDTLKDIVRGRLENCLERRQK